MRLRLTFAASFLALATIAGAQQGQYSNRLLQPESERLLNEKSAIAYGAALEAYDRVAPADTARQLANAAAMQPEFVELQFRALELCIERAEILYGAEATEFWDLADTVVKRLQVNPLLRQEERERARRADELINGRPPTADRPAMKSARDSVLERDEARFKTGLALMEVIQDQRITARGLTKIQLMGPSGLPTAKPDDGSNKTPLLDPFALLPGEAAPVMPGAGPVPVGGTGRGGGAIPLPDSGANPFGGAAPPPAAVPAGNNPPAQAPGFEG